MNRHPTKIICMGEVYSDFIYFLSNLNKSSMSEGQVD